MVKTCDARGPETPKADPPALDNGDDVVHLDVELVGLAKVLQRAHVCGHGLEKTSGWE